MSRDLEGRAIVVTGAAAGLGKAFARHCASRGASTVLGDVDIENAIAVAKGIRAEGGAATAVSVNVSSAEEAQALIEACVDEFGQIDGLVNNAGVEVTGMPSVSQLPDIARMFDVNVLGAINCGLAAMKYMTERGSGSIVNVTSGAHLGLRRMAAYAATKGAIASLTHCWALDLESLGVRCNAISPLAATHMFRVNLMEEGFTGTLLESRMQQLPTADDNAPLVGFLLSDAAADVTGQIVRFDSQGLTVVSHPVLMPRTVSVGDVPFDVAVEDLRSDFVPIGVKRLSAGASFVSIKADL